MNKKQLLLIYSLCWHFISVGQEYLYVNPDHISNIQAAIQTPSTHHTEAFNTLKWRVDQNKLKVYGPDTNRYNRSYFAQEAALLSLLAPEAGEREHYAQLAYTGIRAIYEHPEQERLPHTDYGLSRAMMQLALALPYTWSKTYWTISQRDYVEQKINEALDAWLSYDHANFWKTRGSNWVAVCRGSELVLLLASGQKTGRIERYEFLVEQLKLHIQNGYGSLGVSQEGIGYTEYGGQFLLKAVYAAASLGDQRLLIEAQKKAWWKQAMYIQSFQPQSRKVLMTGVAGPGAYNEGWASLLLPLAPADSLPYFLWWYDRRIGRLSPGSLQEQFDHQRAGTIWSILYYPLETTAKDPTGVFPASVEDDHGYFFFRNRWQNQDDILLSIMADEEHHSHAWDQPEVFALNLMAYNTRFIGGPSKERADSLYSSLLVDGKYNIRKSTHLTGKTIDWQTNQRSAHVLIDGGLLYDSLGVEKAERQLAIKFLKDNQAIICLMDTLESSVSHQYTWQLNLGDHLPEQKIEISKKGSHFQLKGAQGQVDAWIVNPTDFKIADSIDPFQVHFSGKNKRIMVILLLHQNNDLTPKIYTKKGSNQFRLLNHIIHYDKDTGRINIE